MKKLFDKDEVWFAVAWILVYVLGFGNADSISEAIGVPKLLTVAVGLVLAAVLYGFIRKNQLTGHVGLCRVQGQGKALLWFLPLVVISSVNFWNGVTIRAGWLETVLYILSMCLVGFLEEVIFRGLLFQGMRKQNMKAAVVVSSLTFGVGHIVNLLLGAPLLDTLLQLMYASAIGFCYTAVFCVSGSILPCVVSHVFVNSTSIFAQELSNRENILIAVAQTILSIGYGIWLLRKGGEENGEYTSAGGVWRGADAE